VVSPERPHRSVVVTGGGSGIGRAVVTRLLEDGDAVVAVGRSAERLEGMAKALNAGELQLCPGSVADRAVLEQAADLAERRAPLGGWVNSAAIFEASKLEDADDDRVHDTLAVNLEAVIEGSAVALRRFVASETPGAIVSISSIHASHAYPGWSAYAAAKAGIEGFTRAIAVQYGPKGIRANAVAPGLVAIERYLEGLPPPGSRVRTEHEAWLAEAYPLGRAATPAEVAAAVAFLLSADAMYITGITLPVDGGLSIAGRPVPEFDTEP
jgi:NAD(P)-dependent dehydrogenase (short-subunit alcohol dehydrogenase family)